MLNKMLKCKACSGDVLYNAPKCPRCGCINFADKNEIQRITDLVREEEQSKERKALNSCFSNVDSTPEHSEYKNSEYNAIAVGYSINDFRANAVKDEPLDMYIKVYIDGKRLYNSGSSIKVQPGKHSVIVKFPAIMITHYYKPSYGYITSTKERYGKEKGIGWRTIKKDIEIKPAAFTSTINISSFYAGFEHHVGVTYFFRKKASWISVI